jgi:tetratricopeptide (TPR) repeat protein
VFPDSLLPNLLIFTLGLSAAFYWLRTGMLVRGVLVLAALAAAVDVAVVSRFVYEQHGAVFEGSLWAMQVVALCSASVLVYRLARRQWSADKRRRDELLSLGMQCYLREDLHEARVTYRRLHRADPWDVPACIGLANVALAAGEQRKARAMYRRAVALDRERLYVDFVNEQLKRAAPAKR